MITRFDDKYEFDKEYRGTIAQSIRYEGKDTLVKVYIHNLMPNIIHGGSGKSRLSCNYHGIFANTPETMPAISDTKITEKNYLLARVDINSSLDDISIIKRNVKIRTFQVEFDIFADSPYMVKSNSGEIFANTYQLSTVDKSYRYLTDNTGEENMDVYGESFYDSSLKETSSPNNPVAEPKLYQTNNEEGKNFVILTKDCDPDVNPEFIFTTADHSYNNRLCIYKEDNTFLYKSNDVVDGMYYEVPYEDNEYILKQGAEVRCKFLGRKTSNLYINTDNT